MSYSERLVVITGAAGGIGRETAKLFLQRGASLLLIDRNEAALQDLEKSLASPTRVRTLTSALESPKACAHAIGCAHRPIYALVHMAVNGSSMKMPAHLGSNYRRQSDQCI